jgi:hypothetical protein
MANPLDNLCGPASRCAWRPITPSGSGACVLMTNGATVQVKLSE